MSTPAIYEAVFSVLSSHFGFDVAAADSERQAETVEVVHAALTDSQILTILGDAWKIALYDKRSGRFAEDRIISLLVASLPQGLATDVDELLGRSSEDELDVTDDDVSDSRQLPDHRSGDDSWRSQANCFGIDQGVFFPEKGGNALGAKRVCRGCDVRAECLDYALGNSERFGVWGGMSVRERRKLARQHHSA